MRLRKGHAAIALILVLGLAPNSRAFNVVATLDTGSPHIDRGALDAGGGYVYLLSHLWSPLVTRLTRVRLSDFQVVGSVDLLSTEVGRGIAIDPAHDLGYVVADANAATNTPDHPAQIIKFKLSTMTLLARRSLNNDQWTDSTIALEPAGDYGYVTYWNASMGRQTFRSHGVVKLRLSDLMVILQANTSMYDNESLEYSGLDSVNHHLFLPSGQHENLSVIDTQTLEETVVPLPRNDFLAAPVVDAAHGQLYIGSNGYEIFQLSLSNLSVTAQVSLNPIYHWPFLGLDDRAGMLYAANSGWAALRRIPLHPLSPARSIPLSSIPGCVLVDNVAQIAYVGSAENADLYKVDISTLALHQLSPNAAAAGSAGLTVDLQGKDFTADMTAYWNGIPLVTRWSDAYHAQAEVPSHLLTTPGLFSITISRPSPDAESSDALTFTVTNPAPMIIGVTPGQVSAGSPDTTLDVQGNGFVPTSQLTWNGTNLSTIFLSATHLRATVPGGDLAAPGTATIVVVNPNPGGGSSSPFLFTIQTPAPTLSRLSPDAVTAEDPAFTLTVFGTGFIPGVSQGAWNGASRATHVLSSTQLAIQVASSDIQNPGANSVTVSNGGGLPSAALLLTVIEVPGQPRFTHLENPSTPASVAEVDATGHPDHFDWQWELMSAPNQAPSASVGAPIRTTNATSPGGMVRLASIPAVDPGHYRVTVYARNRLGAKSAPAITELELIANAKTFVNVFPNPWILSQHGSHPLTFTGLGQGSTLKIFSLSGKLIVTLLANDPTMWDLKNPDGDRVASGLYFYLGLDDAGNKVIGRFAVVK